MLQNWAALALDCLYRMSYTSYPVPSLYINIHDNSDDDDDDEDEGDVLTENPRHHEMLFPP